MVLTKHLDQRSSFWLSVCNELCDPRRSADHGNILTIKFDNVEMMRPSRRGGKRREKFCMFKHLASIGCGCVRRLLKCSRTVFPVRRGEMMSRINCVLLALRSTLRHFAES